MLLHGQLMVEIVIRKKQVDKVPEEFLHIINQFKQYESEDRLVLDVPIDWYGLKDGTVISMLKEFNEAMYLALAYFTEIVDELVTDFEGNDIDKYEVVYQGKRVIKYVKKKLRIVKILDKEKNIFYVKGYELDIRYSEPVVSVLDVYSGGLNSGISLSQFIGRSDQ